MADTAEEQQAAPRNKFPVAAYIMAAQTIIRSMAETFVQAILKPYLHDKLLFTKEEALSLVHGRRMVATFFMPLGAIFASSLFSRYTIVIIEAILFATGHLVCSIGSIPALRERYFLFIYWTIEGIGLFMAGGAFLTFGADQFKSPRLHNQLLKYYGMIYVLYNVGSLLATFISPLVRTHIACFGEQDCYSIDLGISTMLYSLGAIVYLANAKYFVRHEPTYEIIINFCGCLCIGFKNWVCQRKANPRPNWLDHAEQEYGAQLVEDIKRYFQILLVLATFPVYFAVYYQMDTKWSSQTARMDGRISGTLTITPDDFELLNPILVIVLVPIITKVFDPITDKWGFDRTLRRVILGMGLVAVSSLMAGYLETHMKQAYPRPLQRDESELRIFNGLNCSYIIRATDIGIIETYPLGVYTKKHIPVDGQRSIQLSSTDACAIFSVVINLKGGKAISGSVRQNKDGTIGVVCYEEIIEKSDTGFPVISVLGLDISDSLAIVDSKEVYIKMQPDANDKPHSREVVPETYTMVLNGRRITSEFALHLGGVYVALIVGNDSMSLHEVVEPNSIHLLWICPQTIVLTLGEIYIEVSILTFLYGEAPTSLKQVVLATYVFMNIMGEGGSALMTTYGPLEQDHEFYVSAIILSVDIAVLFLLALRFQPSDASTKVI